MDFTVVNLGFIYIRVFRTLLKQTDNHTQFKSNTFLQMNLRILLSVSYYIVMKSVPRAK
jgi:hypothetical protein